MKKIILILGIMSPLTSQVTIGSGHAPEKGVLYPRVSLKNISQLTPLYRGVDNGDGTWTDPSTPNEKQLATGMMVYNINPETTDIEEVGIFVWNGKKYLQWDKQSLLKYNVLTLR